MAIKLKYKQAKTIREFVDMIRLRVDVFIREQGFAPGWEPDEDDKESRHYVAFAGGEVVGTARVRENKNGMYKIERMAIKKEFRKKGVGGGLLRYIIKKIKKLRPKKIWLQSQAHAQNFYKKCGFSVVGKEFNHHGLPHVSMVYKIKKV